MAISNVYNQDCLIGMKEFPDKFFELAIVDPPYGINEDGKSTSRHRGNAFTIFEIKKWDRIKPDAKYFKELIRVSQNRIIWGGNYFVDHLQPSMGWIFWDKLLGCDFSDGELAYTSFDRALRKFIKSPERNYATNAISAAKYKRIHPTQKPIHLYKWLLQNYANPNDKILDTHLGSQSSRIAAYKLGFDFWGYELDEDYFKEGCERFAKSIAEPLFDAPKFEQGNFFTQKP